MNIEIASAGIPTKNATPVTFHTAASASPEEIGISFAPAKPPEASVPAEGNTPSPTAEQAGKTGEMPAALYGGEGDLYQRVRAPYFGRPQPIKFRNDTGCPMATLPQNLQILQNQPLKATAPLTPGAKITVTPRDKFFGEPQPLRVRLSGIPVCSTAENAARNFSCPDSGSCSDFCASCGATQFSAAVPAPAEKPAAPLPEFPRSPLDAQPAAFGENLEMLRARSAGFCYEDALSVSARHYRAPLPMLLLTLFFGGALGLDRFLLRESIAGFFRLFLTVAAGVALALSLNTRGVLMAAGGLLTLAAVALWVDSVRTVRRRTADYNTALFLSSIPQRSAEKSKKAPVAPAASVPGAGFFAPVMVIGNSTAEQTADVPR